MSKMTHDIPVRLIIRSNTTKNEDLKESSSDPNMLEKMTGAARKYTQEDEARGRRRGQSSRWPSLRSILAVAVVILLLIYASYQRTPDSAAVDAEKIGQLRKVHSARVSVAAMHAAIAQHTDLSTRFAGFKAELEKVNGDLGALEEMIVGGEGGSASSSTSTTRSAPGTCECKTMLSSWSEWIKHNEDVAGLLFLVGPLPGMCIFWVWVTKKLFPQ